METIVAAASLVGGLLLRLGLPLAVTAGAVWLLRRLDARWQMETDQARTPSPAAWVERCWEIRGCPADRVVNCSAYQDQSQPCWQHFRDRQGNLQQRCLACQLFQQAVAPAATRQAQH